MKKVMILFGHYTPSINAGGPVVSLRNLAALMYKNVEFYIIASDRELGSDLPFKGIKSDVWCKVEDVNVIYTNIDRLTVRTMQHLIEMTECEILYINSVFSIKFSIIPLVLKKIGCLKGMKVVLAPRGSFSPGAMQIRNWKKINYLKWAKRFALFTNITWHATTTSEKQYIKENIGQSAKVIVAPNIGSKPPENTEKVFNSFLQENVKNKVRLIFISRIHPKKNLIGAIRALRNVSFEIEYDIYGPIEDEMYWKKCMELITLLPKNITVRYCGLLNNNEIFNYFSKYDMFYFLTLGENFGHVIYESLIAGCPILISDQTPWSDVEKFEAGYVVELEAEDDVVKILEDFSNKSLDEKMEMRVNARDFALYEYYNKIDTSKYKEIFNLNKEEK